MVDERRAVYRRGTYPGQVDHPGWLSKVVETREALEMALAEGWSLTMTDPPPRQQAEPDSDPLEGLRPFGRRRRRE